MRNLFSLVVLALVAHTGQAQLRVGEIQTCHGHFGPAREAVYDQGDDVFLRCKIIGAKPNGEGHVIIDMHADVFDPEGKSVKHATATADLTQLFSNETTLHTQYSIPSKSKPGEYRQRISLKDNQTGAETFFTHRFTVLPERLAILPPQFSYDEEGKLCAPNGGLVSQIIFYKAWVVGVDISKGIADFEVAMEIRDSSGRKVLWPLKKIGVRETDPEKLPKINFLATGGALPLECPGDFIFHIVATDNIAGKMVSCDFPLHIEAPGKGMPFGGGSREMATPLTTTPPRLIPVSSPPK